jgi:hypothetical protein
MYLRETEWSDVEWFDPTQVRYKQWAVVDTVMNLWVP